MLSYNPYIAGNPVYGQGQFIGRSDILRDVEQTLRNPSANALVLFGQRRIGKTSVLLHIEQELRAKDEFRPVYFDLQDKAALPLEQVLYQLAQVMAQTTGAPLPDRRKFDAAGAFFHETFIPQAVEACHQSGLVLLLDEFDVLDLPQHERAGVTFFPYLRDWMRATAAAAATAARMQFVFVLGRRPEELSTDTLSTFKGILARRVSLMKRDDTEAIIRQSEADGNKSLRWSAEAVERVWHWTQGHPYFTQLLCSEVWETTMENEEFGGFGFDTSEKSDADLPIVQPDQVDAAIDDAIEQGANALQWIWNGLPPAERIVMAAMAEAEGEQISQEELAEILNRSKVRLILRELDLAPETLIAWDLLRLVDTDIYRFAIPLLRHWVATEKPLRRVKANLDNLEPLAEALYQSAEGFSKIGNVDEAERQLRNALGVNPYHFRSRLLLGKVLLAKGEPEKAVEELKPAYEFDARSAKSQFIIALMAVADAKAEAKDEQQQLALYDQVLSIEPNQPEALKKKTGLKRRQASELLKQGDLDSALQIYEEIGDQKGIEQVAALKRRQEAEQRLHNAQRYEASEDWNAAIALYQESLVEFPDDEAWRERLEIAQLHQHLADLYARGVAALGQGKRDVAQDLFAEIIGIEPTYKDAWRYLGIAAKGIDVNELLNQQQEAAQELNDLKQKTVPKPSRLLLGFLIAVWFAFLIIGGRTLYDFGHDRGRADGLLAAITPTVMPTQEPTPIPTAIPAETPSPTPAMSPTPTPSQVAQLTAEAKVYVQREYLTTPDGQNAFETCKQILALEPTHAEARKILKDILKKYKDWGDVNVRQAEYDKAQTNYARYVMVADYWLNTLADQSISSEYQQVQNALTELLTTPTPLQTDSNPDAAQMYQLVYMAYVNGQFNDAISGFERYLELYPDTQRADLAQYWIAESFFSLGEFETALQEYDRLITQYPNSDRIPAAYFSKGDTYLKLGREIEAISHLRYIVNQFPNTTAAQRAEERLKTLE